jgi:hypothetical protein
MQARYVIETPLAGCTDQWLELARCVTPQGAAEVIRCLLEWGGGALTTYRIRVVVEVTP